MPREKTARQEAQARGLVYVLLKIDERTAHANGGWIEFKGGVTQKQADRLGKLLVEILSG